MKDPASFKVMGKSVARVDIPARSPAARPLFRTCGCPAWCMPASCVPRATARNCGVDSTGVEKCPESSKSCATEVTSPSSPRRNLGGQGDEALAARAKWEETQSLPKHDDLANLLTGLPSQDLRFSTQRRCRGRASARGQLHPALSDAWLDRPVLRGREFNDGAHDGVDAHAGGLSRPPRHAEMLRMPRKKSACIHVEGSGCYGHNGADDAAADAA